MEILQKIRYQGEDWKIVEFDADGLVRLMAEDRYDKDEKQGRYKKVCKWVSKSQIEDDESKEGIILRDKNVIFKKDGELYQVSDKDELIGEYYDYNRAENCYEHCLDKDVALMSQKGDYDE